MPKRGTIQLSVSFIVILILSVVIFGMGIFFVQKINSSAGSKLAQADEQAKLEMARLRNEGETVALAPTTVQGQGTILLMIANDGSVGSNEFGFKVFHDTCLNGPCGAASPIDWISYSTKGSEDEPIEIEPYKSREFLIAVNPKGNSAGTYVFNIEVKYESNGVPNIQYGMGAGKDELYKSLLKFYVKV